MNSHFSRSVEVLHILQRLAYQVLVVPNGVVKLPHAPHHISLPLVHLETYGKESVPVPVKDLPNIKRDSAKGQDRVDEGVGQAQVAEEVAEGGHGDLKNGPLEVNGAGRTNVRPNFLNISPLLKVWSLS